MQIKTPSDSIKAGVVLVPEDRKAQGVVLSHTVATNLALGLRSLGEQRFHRSAPMEAFAVDAIKRLGVRTKLLNWCVISPAAISKRSLSLAGFRADRRSLFSMNQPGESTWEYRAAIYETITDLAKAGMAVVVVSSDLEEVMELSHRVLVLARGRNQGILEGPQITNVAIMERATA